MTKGAPGKWLIVALVGSIAANAFGLGWLAYRRYFRVLDDRPHAYWTSRGTLFAALPVPEGGVVMLGDSITDWCEWHELLQRPDVVNRGLNSDTVAGARARLDTVLTGQPATVAIMLGINDLLAGTEGPEIVAEYRGLLQGIRERAPKARIIVQSVLPVNRALLPQAPAAAKIRALNRDLEKLCRQVQCTYLALHDLFATESGELDPRFTFDGIHLQYQGYRVWRDALIPLL